MATATIIGAKKVEWQRARSLPAPPHALQRAARAFLRLPGVDVVWLAVRESRAQAAVIRCSEGARSAAGLGLEIEPGIGVGGALLLAGEPWRGELIDDGVGRLSAKETAFLTQEAVKRVMVVPLRTMGLRGETHSEGIVYAAARRKVAWTNRTLEVARRVGERVARTCRDAQRVWDVTQRWEQMWTQLGQSGEAADCQLDQVARQIAADARAVFRSGIGIVFRLDAASGALHSLAQDGEVVPGEIVPAVRRGQVLPRECGCAGRAVSLRKPFIAPDYGSGCVVVPPIMAEAVERLPAFTTLSFPLIVGHDVIGAVTVGRLKTTPFVDYVSEDLRLAAQLARAAAPLLVRAQQAAEHARRQQGASALSRLAESLTWSLSVSAVCEQLMRSVVALVRGNGASIWGSHDEIMFTTARRSEILGDPKDPRLERILEQVGRSRQAFWTSDLANDPRLASPDGATPHEPSKARAVLVAPIRIRETLLGVLGVTGDTGRAFTDADVELVQALADQAALGIANARAYDELQVSNVQVLRHEKLVAMGRLTAGLAHELRNPLQNVVGLTSELVERSRGSLREHPEFVDFPEYLRRAHGEAKRAAEIVDRLLDHIRERTPAFDTVDVRRVAADAVAIVTTGGGGRGAQIAVMSDDAPVVVRADAIMLRQVVLNLLNNALDAVDGSGEITVLTRTDRNRIGAARAVVSVSDTGRGVPADQLSRVFEPFFTTKDVGRGVGLGLAICQSFIEQHGGTIRAESAGIGQGMTVEFELPLEP
jgi:two-component system NtrC family sensor kinase